MAGHLVKALGPMPREKAISALEDVVKYLSGAVRETNSKAEPGICYKRTPVKLVAAKRKCALIEATSQPMSEVQNQIAQMQRIIAYLREVNTTDWVLRANPSTTSEGHDLELAPDEKCERRTVCEASDVSGPKGNENKKMLKDLYTLGHSAKDASINKRRLIVSKSSHDWLKRNCFAQPKVIGPRDGWKCFHEVQVCDGHPLTQYDTHVLDVTIIASSSECGRIPKTNQP